MDYMKLLLQAKSVQAIFVFGGTCLNCILRVLNL
jgi:hypothetical protein